MLTAQTLIAKYGEPAPAREPKYMTMWLVPSELRAFLPAVPAKIYCHKAMPDLLATAFRNLISRGLAKELKTWDGCFAVRRARGLASWSLHSWGCAVDLNAANNQLGAKPTLSVGFVKCFIDAGFDWGGTWSRPDGMHFQLKSV